MKGIFSFAVTYLSPFLVVVLHWCLGRYTIESWFLFFPLWYSPYFTIWLLFWKNSVFESLGFHRTPFKLDSALSYAIVALLEIFFIASVMCVLGAAISLLMGCMVFANICFLDMKFIFAQIDGCCKLKNSDTLQIEFITEIFVFHGRVNGYYPSSNFFSFKFWMHVRHYFRFMCELKNLMSFVVLVTLTPWTMCTCFSLFLIATVKKT